MSVRYPASKCCSTAATRSAFFLPSVCMRLSLTHSDKTATVNWGCQKPRVIIGLTNLGQCPILVVILHVLVGKTLRLLRSLALLVVVSVASTLRRSIGQAQGHVGLLERLEAGIKLFGPLRNEVSSTLILSASLESLPTDLLNLPIARLRLVIGVLELRDILVQRKGLNDSVKPLQA